VSFFTFFISMVIGTIVGFSDYLRGQTILCFLWFVQSPIEGLGHDAHLLCPDWLWLEEQDRGEKQSVRWEKYSHYSRKRLSG